MRRKILIVVVLTAILTVFAAPSAFASHPKLSRAQIQANSGTGLQYPYGWGYESWDNTKCGCWKYGKCKDSNEPWGADCSGYVQKSWQVPTALDFKKELTSNRFTSQTFRCRSTSDWTKISTSNMKYMDALSYYSDCSKAGQNGHIALYTGKSGSNGYRCVNEARSCSYGILYNCRTFSSSYVALKRSNLTDS